MWDGGRSSRWNQREEESHIHSDPLFIKTSSKGDTREVFVDERPQFISFSFECSSY